VKYLVKNQALVSSDPATAPPERRALILEMASWAVLRCPGGGAEETTVA